MRTTQGQWREQPESARWRPKKRDDTLIERWARACSAEHGGCRGCDLADKCRDLAGRLIRSMSTASGGPWKRPGTGTQRGRSTSVLTAD